MNAGLALVLLLLTAAEPTPTRSPHLAPTRVIRSPEELTAALERRWTIENIRSFCIPSRRHWNGCQNLVTGFHKGPCQVAAVWHGELFKGVETGFDRIAWYSDACDGVAETYSLGCTRGRDFWLLEIASPASFGTKPNVTPSPKQLCFEGGDHSRFR